MAASSSFLRGETARAEGVAGAGPSQPQECGRPQEARRRCLGPRPSYPSRLGRAAARSEVKRLWRARVSLRRDWRPGIPRVPGAARGGPCGRPAARRTQRLAAVGAPGAFASILRAVRGGGERKGRLWRAGAACRARGAAPLAAMQLCARRPWSWGISGSQRLASGWPLLPLAQRTHPRRKAKRLTGYL